MYTNVHFKKQEHTLNIITRDEFTDKLDAQDQLLQLSTGWGIFDTEQFKLARGMGYPAASYGAVYAVEGEELLSKVEVMRIKYEMPRGSETVSGITGVLTRRDKSRLGLARKLLEEAHKREREAGLTYSTLWTQRNNKAHELYASLGYVDVFGPPLAILKTSRSGERLKDLELRTATADDAELLHELHSKINRGRIGFVERYRNYWQIMFALGFEKPDSIQIVLDGGKPVGYARFKEDHNWANSYEVIVEKDNAETVIDLFEEKANGGWLVFGNTFVLDADDLLKKRKYVFSYFPYFTLMAKHLDQNGERDLTRELGTDVPGFVCHQSDRF